MAADNNYHTPQLTLTCALNHLRHDVTARPLTKVGNHMPAAPSHLGSPARPCVLCPATPPRGTTRPPSAPRHQDARHAEGHPVSGHNGKPNSVEGLTLPCKWRPPDVCRYLDAKDEAAATSLPAHHRHHLNIHTGHGAHSPG